jgi:hypothetical protein
MNGDGHSDEHRVGASEPPSEPPHGLTGAGPAVPVGAGEPESLRRLNILTRGAGPINPGAGRRDASRAIEWLPGHCGFALTVYLTRAARLLMHLSYGKFIEFPSRGQSERV